MKEQDRVGLPRVMGVMWPITPIPPSLPPSLSLSTPPPPFHLSLSLSCPSVLPRPVVAGGAGVRAGGGGLLARQQPQGPLQPGTPTRPPPHSHSPADGPGRGQGAAGGRRGVTRRVKAGAARRPRRSWWAQRGGGAARRGPERVRAGAAAFSVRSLASQSSLREVLCASRCGEREGRRDADAFSIAPSASRRVAGGVSSSRRACRRLTRWLACQPDCRRLRRLPARRGHGENGCFARLRPQGRPSAMAKKADVVDSKALTN